MRCAQILKTIQKHDLYNINLNCLSVSAWLKKTLEYHIQENSKIRVF